ncbi:MAG: ankyrin repeat domain-containing protein, partial [Cyanobacteria bacterium]|nr:ankyrin repeat domain-containing protein [Cyanobacteriota bacterium]
GISVKDYLDHRDHLGMSALHWAAMQPKDKCAQMLVSQGASLNIKNSRGKTPLHWAVSLGNLDIIKLLAWKGAQLDIPDDEGVTPRALATQSTKPGVLNALTGGYR